MVKQKTPYRFVVASLSLLIFSLFAALPSQAVQPTAETKEIKSVIEGMRVRQLGGDQILLEIRGSKMPLPKAVDDSDAAMVLQWTGVRFPVNTDKQDWWDEYSWSVFKFTKEMSNEWWKTYDFPLVQRIQVVSADNDGIKMTITGEKPLKLESIRGMAGSDHITVTLKAESDIKPAVLTPPRPLSQGDPLGMNSPVTLELREVSVRDVFRMLADIKKLNLVIDSTVPDNPMTFSFKNAKFSEVFAYMLRMNDLTYALMGKTLVVGTSESIGKTLGHNVTKEYKVAYGDITKMSAMIMGLVPLPNAPVVDDRRRTLFVTGTPQQHREIEALINRIDHPGRQVMLQARLIEVNDNARQEVETLIASVYKGWIFTYGSSGLTADYTYGNGLVPPNVNPTETTTPGELPIPGVTDSTFPANVVNPAMKMLDAGLKAMETNNKGKVLANPSVVALDGQKASIKLTHNYLYQTGLDESRNPQFAEQETGPTLDITPQIGRDGFITLKLTIETGEIVQFRKSGNSEMPETTKRHVDTQIRVRNGELFVIGGLYQENKTKGVTRVPILSYIPIIGEIFKTRNDKHIKSEMAFIVVPYILDVPTSNAEIYNLPSKSLIQ